jgi:signal transduction histidine kinase
MRLVQKLSLAFIVSTVAVVTAGGVLRAQREVAVLEYDRVRDHRLMGRALGSAIAQVWHSDGEAKALATLEQANVPDGRIRMRWVWLEGAAAGEPAPIDPAMVAATPIGSTVTRVVPEGPAGAMRYTYVPLAVDRARRGALELSESLAGQKRFTNRVVLETIATTLSLAIVSAGLSWLLGLWIVGRPIEALAAKARRVGQGDFTGPLILPQKDELADLAREMNTMCERLLAAHDRVAEESAKKLAILEQLRHADRLTTVGKLASGVAHELGTPLNVVSGRAQMLLDGDASPQEALDYARVIVEASEKMARIIGQLLELARAPLNMAPKTLTPLSPLLTRAREMLAPLAAKRDTSIAVEGTLELSAVIDRASMEQVITNLVVNAVQATSKPGTIRLSLEEADATPPGAEVPRRCAVLRVSDEGEGIKEEHRNHVFEPFFTTKDVGEGTGLGLSVAYGIVQEHDGWITVESELGRGSTFRVFVPLEAEPLGKR